jgi:isopropylmalate/homocitrate/citramalate synthase
MESKWKNENWLVSNYNYKKEVRDQMNLPKKVELHDATLRDGEQTAGIVMSRQEKIEIARKLGESGVHRIEAGMPAVSEEDRKAIEDIKKLGMDSKIFGFVRAKEEDIRMCHESGVDGVIIEVPVGKPKLDLQFKWSIDRVLESSMEAINKARELGLYTVFFPYDTTRADESDLEYLLRGVMRDRGPDSVGIVDTMGCTLPESTDYLVKLVKNITRLPVEIHTHNDFGLAVANSLRAVASGAEVVHACVNGMGERTGNASLEEVVAGLQMLLGIDTGIDMKKLMELSELVENITNFKMAVNKPIVGTANYTRESGIGADTLLKHPLAMFAINPYYLGREPKLVLGKKSGMTSINMKLQELELEIEDDGKKRLLSDVKNAGLEKKRILTDEEFISLVGKYTRLVKKS